ncbi:hypothetical protein [Actinoplanes sp. NPDC051411]|uniref:hypothetical protein n=1 Tax=Actinoplanes sp. NPDC051411 TaxID=3155522 RepID=UPI00343FD640
MRNNHYVPLLANGIGTRIVTNDYLAMHRDAPQKFRAVMSRYRTDRYVLDFQDDYPTVVECSHLALANAINQGNFVLLRQLATALDDKRRRVAVRRLRFLLDNGIQCVPLGVTSAELGLSLFQKFVSSFSPKENCGVLDSKSVKAPTPSANLAWLRRGQEVKGRERFIVTDTALLSLYLHDIDRAG